MDAVTYLVTCGCLTYRTLLCFWKVNGCYFHSPLSFVLEMLRGKNAFPTVRALWQSFNSYCFLCYGSLKSQILCCGRHWTKSIVSNKDFLLHIKQCKPSNSFSRCGIMRGRPCLSKRPRAWTMRHLVTRRKGREESAGIIPKRWFEHTGKLMHYKVGCEVTILFVF